ncbi:MAG: hypothetical protein QXS23_04025 [Desulfurococcaceae archaeon]
MGFVGHVNNSKCTEIVANKVRHALISLDKMMPGFLNRIDLYFIIRYEKPFITLLVENPALAIEELLNIYGGDRDSAKFVIYMVLKTVFAGNIYLVDKAMRLLLENKYSEFIELICNR